MYRYWWRPHPCPMASPLTSPSLPHHLRPQLPCSSSPRTPPQLGQLSLYPRHRFPSPHPPSRLHRLPLRVDSSVLYGTPGLSKRTEHLSMPLSTPQCLYRRYHHLKQTGTRMDTKSLRRRATRRKSRHLVAGEASGQRRNDEILSLRHNRRHQRQLPLRLQGQRLQ